jgi:hypothetical protein
MTTSKGNWKKLEKEDDSPLSKNNGQKIRFRRRLIEDKEARAAYEDALRDFEEDYKKSYGGSE